MKLEEKLNKGWKKYLNESRLQEDNGDDESSEKGPLEQLIDLLNHWAGRTDPDPAYIDAEEVNEMIKLAHKARGSEEEIAAAVPQKGEVERGLYSVENITEGSPRRGEIREAPSVTSHDEAIKSVVADFPEWEKLDLKVCDDKGNCRIFLASDKM